VTAIGEPETPGHISEEPTRAAESMFTVAKGVTGPNGQRRFDGGAGEPARRTPSGRPPAGPPETSNRRRFLRALGWGKLEPVDAVAPEDHATAGWRPREVMTKDLRRADVFVWHTQLQMVARTILLDSGMYTIITRGEYSDPDARQTGVLAPREHYPRELFLVIARRVSIDAWQD
jgi:hypothetical protein